MVRLSSLSARCPQLERPLAVKIEYFLRTVSLLLTLVLVLLFGRERDKSIQRQQKGKQISNASIAFCRQCNMHECNERRLDVLPREETTALAIHRTMQSTMRDLVRNRIGIATRMDALFPSIGG